MAQEAQLNNLKEFSLNIKNEPKNIYLGGGEVTAQFVHCVYDEETSAANAAKELLQKYPDNIFRREQNSNHKKPINVHQYDVRAPQSIQGKYFLRILPKTFEKCFEINPDNLPPRPGMEPTIVDRDADKKSGCSMM
jgi:hypothetical protein